MKANRIQHRSRGGVWLVLGVVATAAVAGAIFLGFDRLRDVYREQCVVVDMSEQVEITSGKMVKPDVLAEEFGLRPGANLAEIDFERRRAEILKKIPTLRELSVTLRLPDRVVIRAEERTPVVRLGLVGRKTSTGRVADREGVVFACARGTHSLPLIREPRTSGTPAGQRLKGRVRAALDLALVCRGGDYLDFGLLEIDASKPDFLVATLGTYARVKICWEGMDEATPAARAALTARLDLLAKAMRARCDGLKPVVWNATLPDYIFADTQEKP